MVAEAESYKEEDKKQLARVEAKNKLENTAFSLRTLIQDDKLPAESKSKLKDAIDETISWLENNSLAEVEEFEYRQNNLEKLAAELTSIPSPSPAPKTETNGPIIEEVD